MSSSVNSVLHEHVQRLLSCRQCPKMASHSVSCGPVVSNIMLVGQAPGEKEPKFGRPFAWTAGKTLFRWFHEHCGVTEEQFRRSIYMAAVCRCFPGKKEAGGDRVPDPTEIATCGRWLEAEITILRPLLILPVGKLAIQQFLPMEKLEKMIGKTFPGERAGHTFDVIPLPHPSGASPWHRMEPGKSLLVQGLQALREHPAWKACFPPSLKGVRTSCPPQNPEAQNPVT